MKPSFWTPDVILGGKPDNGRRKNWKFLVLLGLGIVTAAPAQTSNEFSFGLHGGVGSMALQPDGKILVAGLSAIAEQPCGEISRLMPDGSLDSEFNVVKDQFYNPSCLSILEDGRILAGAWFPHAGSPPFTPDLGLFDLDGGLENTFWTTTGLDFGGSLIRQEDGKLLVRRSRLIRLNADGSQDNSFHCAVEPVDLCLPLTDGKILVAGWGTNWLQRINPDGTLDDFSSPPTRGEVFCMLVQPDGKILVAGIMLNPDGASVETLVRLNADGSRDPSFTAPFAGMKTVDNMVLQANGKILVAGYFGMVGAETRTNFARLNPDGTLDATLPAVPYDLVTGLLLRPDGTLLFGAGRVAPDTRVAPLLVQVHNTEPAVQSLNYDASTITWLRGGSSPELWRTWFAYTTNGATWIDLGAGTRIAGGWQMTGVPLPDGATLRARGYVISTWGSGFEQRTSDWYMETTVGPAQIVQPPSSRTNNAGTTAVFTAFANGSPPLVYQWRKNGVDLTDGPEHSGTSTPRLTLNQVFGKDVGDYAVVVSNLFGSALSAGATLKVVDPFILTQPADEAVDGGQTVSLSVGARGTAPMAYQWRKDGISLGGASSSVLTLLNVGANEIGHYDVVLSNSYSTVTSTPALLTVNLATMDTWGGVEEPTYTPPVFALAEQADSSILVGGLFNRLSGETRTNFGRLLPDGTPDGSFSPPVTGGGVFALAVQADGKILLAGGFSALDGQAQALLGRLNPDGSLDGSFRPSVEGGLVTAVLIQADNKILVGGGFTNLCGQPRQFLGRLNADGSLDRDFAPVVTASAGFVYCLALQDDDKILVAGTPFQMVRLDADGSLDTSFGTPANGYVTTVVVQPDGGILALGGFSSLGGVPCAGFGRLEPDGTFDASFRPGAVDAAFCLQADGRIFVTSPVADGQLIQRLNLDGTSDYTFGLEANDWLSALTLEADGKVLVAGDFTRLDNQDHKYLGRVVNTAPATQTLTWDGTTVTWLRGGTSPEVSRTRFDCSTNGVDWTYLGAGTRVPGGWQLAGISLSPGQTLRAQGYVSHDSSSTWWAESRVTVGAGPSAILLAEPSLGPAGGRLSFKVHCQTGRQYVIEASSDLRQWAAIATNSPNANLFDFSDPDAPTLGHRYYRIRQQ